MDANELKKDDGKEGQLSGTMAAFQQLLEVIPDDPLALESLFEAYREAGDHVQALKYLDRLITVLLREGNTDVGNHLRSLLLHLMPEFPEVASRVAQLDAALQATGQHDAAGAEELQVEPTPRQTMDIQTELALAWRLFHAGELAQEEYSNVVQDLTEISTKKSNVPVSVLHALHDRNSKNLEKIMYFMSKNSGKPIIALAHFEIPKEAYQLLPLDFISHWGAIVFEMLGQDLLVAVLNPFDRVLQSEVTSLTGRNCHFYMTSAPEYDNALDVIRKALAKTPEPAKPG
ncbi:MAG: hypothetical protein NTV49_02470 [Kiritimatiellaeota bacterium]|nr:hypothetical protein [Kiritimatiellota bacterium]